MTYSPNPNFARDCTPSMRITDPEQRAEQAVVDELAVLTERHGPWDAALLMFSTDWSEAAA